MDAALRTLVAEDDPLSRRILETLLPRWGYEVVSVDNGARAWEVLGGDQPPRLAILDWMMPEVDGVELCRRVRGIGRALPTYVIMLTACDRREDLLAGFDAGADDYLVKPVDHDELRVRLRNGARIIQLQENLTNRVRDLEDALKQVSHLQGLLPICAWCKKIRDDQNYWQKVEDYLAAHMQARFTHGICPDCIKQELANQQLKRNKQP